MQSHKRRILLSGFAILVLSLLAGLAVSFYQWDRGSPFDRSTWGEYGFNPVGRAIAPLALIFMFFPITVPVIIAGVRGTAALLQPEADLPMARAWLSMLVFFDVVFITRALWTFEPVMTD